MKYTLRLPSLLLLALVWITQPLMAQNAKQNEGNHQYGVRMVPKYRSLNLSETGEGDYVWMKNTRVAPGHGESLHNQDYAEAKARVNAAKVNAEAPSSEARTAGGSLVLGSNFFGNGFDGIPNDNSMAIGRDGSIVSTTNSVLKVYNPAGAQQLSRSFGLFYTSADTKYDPRVTYDPEADRWIFVFLNGSASNTSEVIVCFSETDDPTGNWNVYAIEGNAAPSTFGNCWTDYPQIALSKEELFITGNLFNNNDSYQGGYIWQIDKSAGYTGSPTLPVAEYSGSGNQAFAMAPAEGNFELYSRGMHFVSTLPSPFSATTTVWLHEISDTIGGSGTSFDTYLLSSNTAYGLSPDATQQGTSVVLDTRNNRVRAIYRQGDRIHFGLNATIQNRTELYHGTIQNLDFPVFAAATGYYVEVDSFDILFPALAYGGETSTTGTNSSIMCFIFSSASHYPGNACVYIDTLGNVGPPLILKEGFTFLDRLSGNTERVGDYQDVAPHYANPGEYWMAGYIGYGSNQHGTWISQLYANGTPPLSAPQPELPEVEMQVYPNPSAGLVTVEFEVPENARYEASLWSLDGKKLRVVAHDRLRPGEARLDFHLEDFPSGTYLLQLRLDDQPIHTERVVIAR